MAVRGISDRWWRRRRVVLTVLFVVVAVMVGRGLVSVVGYVAGAGRRFTEQMSWAYEKAVPQYTKVGEVSFKPVPAGFARSGDPGRWWRDPLRPEGVRLLSGAVAAYNRLHPRYRTSVGRVRSFYGPQWEWRVREDRVFEGNPPRFIAWCRRRADVVWARDGMGSDGVVHHRGDAVDFSDIPSNFEFISHAHDADGLYKGFRDFELRAEHRAGK